MHLLDGDNQGNKLMAVEEGDEVIFLTVMVNTGRTVNPANGHPVQRVYFTIPKARIIALAKVLEMGGRGNL